MGRTVIMRELRLRTLADVIAYADACGWSCARTAPRPRSAAPAPTAQAAAFVSGKHKQNTIKPTVVSDEQGRTLWSTVSRAGQPNMPRS